jgi:glycine dehydrogenase
MVGDVHSLDVSDPSCLHYICKIQPNGAISDFTFAKTAHEKEVFLVMGADLSLLLMKSPGEMIATSSREQPTLRCPYGLWRTSCSFFIPEMSLSDKCRVIIGASIDASGNPGYRGITKLRQHIRRKLLQIYAQHKCYFR